MSPVTTEHSIHILVSCPRFVDASIVKTLMLAVLIIGCDVCLVPCSEPLSTALPLTIAAPRLTASSSVTSKAWHWLRV